MPVIILPQRQQPVSQVSRSREQQPVDVSSAAITASEQTVESSVADLRQRIFHASPGSRRCDVHASPGSRRCDVHDLCRWDAGQDLAASRG
jgi:hypothetical protein